MRRLALNLLAIERDDLLRLHVNLEALLVAANENPNRNSKE
jgi:hypothetical protein